jgi:hypothetical protein
MCQEKKPYLRQLKGWGWVRISDVEGVDLNGWKSRDSIFRDPLRLTVWLDRHPEEKISGSVYVHSFLNSYYNLFSNQALKETDVCLRTKQAEQKAKTA